MKIIQVCPRFLPHIGGIETHVYEISKRLAKKHEVFVYTTDPSEKLPKEEKIDNIIVKRFGSIAPNEAYYFSSGLFHGIKKESCDILHIHSFQALTSIIVINAVKKDKIKKIIFTPHYHPKGGTFFRTILRKFYDLYQKDIFNKSDMIISVSEYEKNKLICNFNIPRKKIMSIPNGIDAKKFAKLSKDKDKNKIKILYVGRLEKYKRIQWILFALKNVVEKNKKKNISLTIIGKGPYKNELLKICENLGIKKYVKFKNNLPYKKLLEEYCSSNVFIMPSEYEAFGIAILEALSCDNILIINKSLPMSNLFSKYGYQITDIIGIENSLIDFISNGSRFNKKFNAKNFDWDEITKKLLKVYRG